MIVKLYYYLAMKALNRSNKLIIGVIVLIWIALESMFYHIVYDAEESYKTELVRQADYHVKAIQNIRAWNASFGGIYVQDDKLQPNPYLKDNMLETDKGKFIKINPAWMTRMLSEANIHEILKFAIVSNKPINKVNKAEGYYAKALDKIEKSHSKAPEYKLDEENKRLNYIQPIYVAKQCLVCHAKRGQRLGDLRGGILVDMDASFTFNRIEEAWSHFYTVTILLGILMFLAFYFVLKANREGAHYLYRNIKLEKRLKEQVKKLNQTLKASGLGYWHWNKKTDEYIVDNHWLDILGLHRDDMSLNFEDWSSRVHPDDLEDVMPIIQEAIRKRKTYTVEYRMQHANGQYIWIEGSGGVTLLDENNEVETLSGTHQDISPRKALEIENRHNASYLNTLFEKNPSIIIVTDGNNIIKANDAFFRFFHEYDSLDTFMAEHKCICEFFQNSGSDDFISSEYGVWIQQVLNKSEPIAKILYLSHEYYFSVHAKKVYEDDMLKIIVTFSDITESYKLRKRFEELSTIDELTQVYNRRHFNKIFKDEYNRAKREKHTLSFAILDIDNFKLYNDNYGHDKGDEALKKVAQEIQNSIKRSNEFFFRLGGEEFGIVFSNTSREAALVYMKKICEMIERLNIEHEYNLASDRLTISIGLCYVEVDEELSLKDIYRYADRALYLAKERGRDRVEMFNHDLQKSQQ